MYYIHYPPGGFGHYMLQMCSICFEDVYCPQSNSQFDSNGTSHDFPKHYKTWFYDEPHDPAPLHDFEGKQSICLIDNNNDHDLGMPNTIRMCIDQRARSIVYQTCIEKAQGIAIQESGEDWQVREQYSLMYHHVDTASDHFLNKFQPIDGVVNINISDLFFHPLKVLQQLDFFGKCDYGRFWTLWNDMVLGNKKYYRAEHLTTLVKNALIAEFDFELQDYSLHDQGYLIYWLEKCYNISEIPPYDYRNWFKNTQEVRTCLNSIRSQ